MAELFDWGPAKDVENRLKHGVTFAEAQLAFLDPRRVIAVDFGHSSSEHRYFCFGIVGNRVMTVRFTLRGGIVRIFGARYWRKGRKGYEEVQRIHG